MLETRGCGDYLLETPLLRLILFVNEIESWFQDPPAFINEKGISGTLRLVAVAVDGYRACPLPMNVGGGSAVNIDKVGAFAVAGPLLITISVEETRGGSRILGVL